MFTVGFLCERKVRAIRVKGRASSAAFGRPQDLDGSIFDGPPSFFLGFIRGDVASYVLGVRQSATSALPRWLRTVWRFKLWCVFRASGAQAGSLALVPASASRPRPAHEKTCVYRWRSVIKSHRYGALVLRKCGDCPMADMQARRDVSCLRDFYCWI